MNIFNNLEFLADDRTNEGNIKSLSRMVSEEKISHAYLFIGNNIDLLYRLALNFAASVNCPDYGCGNCEICINTIKAAYPNLITIEAEGNTILIEDIMELQNFMGLSSFRKGKKVGIIKEAELMNPQASNRLLKTLEEPDDEDSIFILLSEDESIILPTINSRCMVYNWNFKFAEKEINETEFSIIKKIIDAGIREILDAESIAPSLEISLKIIELLKKIEAGIKSQLEKELNMFKEYGFDKSDENKYTQILKSKHKRKINKFNKLGLSRVFDIISAWLEDILAVNLGAKKENLNYENNYFFLHGKKGNVKLDKIFYLINTIEKNRAMLNYSINTELVLDNIFLQIQDLKK